MLRTFSKVYGLSGLRAGYVVASPQAGGVLESLAPALGVNALSQAAAEQALKIGDGEVDGRSCSTDARACSTRWPPCRSMPRRARPTSYGCARLSGAELAARLEEAKVRVAPGGPLGDDDHVRAAIRGGAATGRLLAALAEAIET
ncbi:hypothetical protein BH24ACT24_BH24ACT24_03180 [soil metagenome]